MNTQVRRGYGRGWHRRRWHGHGSRSRGCRGRHIRLGRVRGHLQDTKRDDRQTKKRKGGKKDGEKGSKGLVWTGRLDNKKEKRIARQTDG